ncbi:MAG: hypothetical protein WDN08_12800 [Rhizomicrobium sp.]
MPIRAADLGKTAVSREHPPGLYGVTGVEDALNAVKADTVLLPFGDIGRAGPRPMPRPACWRWRRGS